MIYNYKLLDCTLREGIQAIHPVLHDRGVVFSRQESINIVQHLLDFKIDYLEFGSPVQSKLSSELISTSIKMASRTHTKINIHCRLHEDDLMTALPLCPQGINFYYNLSRSADASESQQTIDKIINFSNRIKKLNPEVSVRFSFENAFKTNYALILQVSRAIQPYVDRIGLPDTTGGAKPSFVRSRLHRFRRDFPDMPLELHFHNDFGLAAANMYEAIRIKNTIIHTTILGIGERNGIVSTSQAIAMGMLSAKSARRVQAHYNVTKLAIMDEYVSQLLQMPVPVTSPITSKGFFCHSAGVHVHGQSLNSNRYQLLNPILFGRKSGYCWASAVVGKANILKRAEELGVRLNAEAAQLVAAQVREYAKVRGGVSSAYVDNKIKVLLKKN